ncbi:ty3-gypsy retrotransposon protein [Cucumis melo var. makuwa]|uniref:Ty3-gypsy retrotransposon protein n=1 Tax=Cucumis melo var. makuwa TaxID=1194695 RepID=A0A5A7T6L9_CUCMM|nr:ty3-gypsy retrotransposon protein [Cucumis melo var. makuwa]
MLQAALTSFHAVQQTQTAPPPAPVEAQPTPVQLSVEAKHLRDFRKYNPKTFDGTMDNPTKAQMWLTSIEKIFRGITWWETVERMLGGDVSKITWEQFKESFYAKFFSTNVKYAKQQEFLNLEQGDMTVEQGLRPDLQDIVRALRPTTHADALRLALDLSLHERADPSKAAGRGLAIGQKRKVESQPDVTPQRNLRLGAVEEFMKVVAWPRAKFALGASNQGISLTLVLENPLRVPHTSLLLPSREEILPLSVRRPSELHVGLEVEPLSGVLSVSTPFGEVLLSKEKIKACQIEIANQMLDVTLLVLDMQDFDLILGMDWLSANHASIDSFHKEVVFNPPSRTSFKFKGAGIVCIPKVISAMKANKLLGHGTWSILASVLDTREPEVFLSSKPVVREYPYSLTSFQDFNLPGR